MSIQRAALTDAREVATVHVAAWQAAYRDLLPSAYLSDLSIDERKAIWERVLEEARSEVYVVRAADGILGFVSFGPARGRRPQTNTGEIQALYVLPDYWSTGLGLALCQRALQRLADAGFSRVELWVLAANERGIRFYERLGFRRVEDSETMIEIGDQAYAEVRYERDVP